MRTCWGVFATIVLSCVASGCSRSPSTPVPGDAAASKPDILLISIDTLRADHVSAYGHERLTTPFVDGLAAEGVLFWQAYSTSSWTVPALVSMLTSSYPTRHGMGQTGGREHDKWEVIPQDLPNLAESLQRHGYRTYGLTANFGLPVERGFARGFDKYNCVGPVDLEVVRESLTPWLAELAEGEPWFLWLHLFDPHAPYLARPELSSFWPDTRRRFTNLDGMPANEYAKRARRFETERMDYVRALYDSEIRHVDDFVREIFGKLPRADEALVVFTADHGEEFLDHGGLLHGRALFNESIRVPLILRFPDRRFAGTVVREPVSLIDIFPTLLSAVGAEAPAPLSGTSLLGAEGITVPGDRVIAAELLRGASVRASIQKDWKFILDGNSPHQTALYELASDPGERRNVAAEQPQWAERLKHWIAAFALENEQAKAEPVHTEITAEQLEALKALGYVR